MNQTTITKGVNQIMLKLFPELMKSNLEGVLGGLSQDIAPHVFALLKGAVRYQINNVATYYWQHPDTDPAHSWNLANDAYFPSLAPPHPVTWFEWEFDTKMSNVTIRNATTNKNDDIDISQHLLGTRVGCLVNSLERTKETEQQFTNKGSSVRWVLQTMTFIAQPGLLPAMLIAHSKTYVCRDGSCNILNSGVADSVINTERLTPGTTTPQDRAISQSASEHIKPAFLAMSFLAANNTIIVDQNPFRRQKKSHRKRKNFRRPGPSYTIPTTYKILEISPLKTTIRERRKSGAPAKGTRKPVPIVRGHFRTYQDTDGHRLFGKLHGTFWIPSRIKGQEGAADRTIKL